MEGEKFKGGVGGQNAFCFERAALFSHTEKGKNCLEKKIVWPPPSPIWPGWPHHNDPGERVSIGLDIVSGTTPSRWEGTQCAEWLMVPRPPQSTLESRRKPHRTLPNRRYRRVTLTHGPVPVADPPDLLEGEAVCVPAVSPHPACHRDTRAIWPPPSWGLAVALAGIALRAAAGDVGADAHAGDVGGRSRTDHGHEFPRGCDTMVTPTALTTSTPEGVRGRGLDFIRLGWSGKRGSNSRPSAWEYDSASLRTLALS